MQGAPLPGPVLVAGAGGGVGRAVARALAGAGHDLALLGRTRAALEETASAAATAGRRAVVLVADVADRAAVAAAAARAREALGPLLRVVNAAGVAESAPLLPADDALFDRAMATNARGAWVLTTACLPDMLAARFGRVVHVASTAALHGARYVAAYTASKHAMLGLVRAAAEDLRGKGVTVNALCPGFLDTPMTERTVDRIVAATGRSRAQALAEVLASAGQERLVPPDAVAEAVLRLLSPDANEVTGAAIPL